MTRYQLIESQQAVLGPEGVPLRIRPQSYQVFSYLLSRENDIVSKDELFAEVWGSVAVTDDSLTQCISEIRKLLGPDYRQLIQTIPKKGYRLASRTTRHREPVISRIESDGLSATEHTVDHRIKVSAPRVPGTSARSDSAQEQNTTVPLLSSRLLHRRNLCAAAALIIITAVALWAVKSIDQKAPDRHQAVTTSGPSIVVYPFKAMNQQQADYFSEGVSADTVVALNRLSNLRVLPLRTAYDQHKDPQHSQSILEEFDPQYVLTGSVWRDADRVRLNIELTDSTNGRLLWSQRYNEVLTDVFQLQETIARSVATALAVNLTAIETQRVFKNPTDNMVAYDYVLTGRSKFRLRNRQDNITARTLFNRAIALDPNYSDAYIGLGETYVEEAIFGYTEWPDESLTTALELAQQAVKIDDSSAAAIGFLALVYFRHDKFELATIEVERALSLNPNVPDLYVLKGLLLSRKGRIAEAIDNLEYARQYDPEIKSGWTELGGLYYLQGDIEKSILTFERGLSMISHIAYVHVMLAAGYAEVGKIDQAKQSATRVRQIVPFFDSQEFSRYSLFRTEEQRARLLDSLAKAGLD